MEGSGNRSWLMGKLSTAWTLGKRFIGERFVGNGIASRLIHALFYDLRVDDKLKLSNEDWGTVTLPLFDAANTPPPSFPELVVFALMSSKVYTEFEGQDDEANDLNELPEGWKLLVTGRSGGYFGAAFLNKETRQVLVAHRGTEINSFWDLYSDVVGIWMNQYESQMGAAMTFSAIIAEFCQQHHLTLLFTGHSLGGWLAQISTFSVIHLQVCKETGEFLNREVMDESGMSIIPPFPSLWMPFTVVFDSPGASKMLCKLRRRFYSNYGCMEVKVRSLPIEVYVTCPNAVNRVHNHVGTVFQVKVKHSRNGWMNMLSLNAATHKMTGILDVLKDTVDVDQISHVRELPFYAWDLVNEPNTAPTYKITKYFENVFTMAQMQGQEKHFLHSILVLRELGQDIGLFFRIPQFKEMMLNYRIDNYSHVATRGIHRFAFIPYVRWIVGTHQEQFEPTGLAAATYSHRTEAYLESLGSSVKLIDLKRDVLGVKEFLEGDCQMWQRRVEDTSVGVAETHASLRALGMQPFVDLHQPLGDSYAVMDFHDFKVINNYLRLTRVKLLVLECPTWEVRSFSWIEKVKQKIILITKEDYNVSEFIEGNEMHVTSGFNFTGNDLTEEWRQMLVNKTLEFQEAVTPVCDICSDITKHQDLLMKLINNNSRVVIPSSRFSCAHVPAMRLKGCFFKKDLSTLKSSVIEEFDAASLVSQGETLIVISDGPGTGKSSILDEIYGYLKTNIGGWVMSIDLSNSSWSSILREWHTPGLPLDVPTLLGQLLGLDAVALSILKHNLSESPSVKTHVILDGLDELNYSDREVTLEFLKQLLATSVTTVIIATRQFRMEKLTQHFQLAVSYSLKRWDEKDQFQFLGYLSDSNKLNGSWELLYKRHEPKLEGLLTIPLFLRIFAEIMAEVEAHEELSKHELCRRIIKNTLRLTKVTKDKAPTDFGCLEYNTHWYYEAFAVAELMPEFITSDPRFLLDGTETEEGLLGHGLLVPREVGGGLRFVNKIFAEFFLAKAILKQLEKHRMEMLIRVAENESEWSSLHQFLKEEVKQSQTLMKALGVRGTIFSQSLEEVISLRKSPTDNSEDMHELLNTLDLVVDQLVCYAMEMETTGVIQELMDEGPFGQDEIIDMVRSQESNQIPDCSAKYGDNLLLTKADDDALRERYW